MSTSSLATLGSLRLEAQYRSDMINNPSITSAEWNSYISKSYKELYDLLVSAYGNEYFVQSPYQLTMTVNQFYALPVDFYKLLGVDLQYSASPTGWVSLKQFNFLDRNKYAYLQPAVNTYAQTAQIWYVPEPTSLLFLPACNLTLNSTDITLRDVTGLSVGMSVDGTGIQTGTTISSINTSTNTVTLSLAATITGTAQTLSFWIDSTQIDGVSGWEEYIIVDAAIKAAIKQESEIVQELKMQKMDMKMRIESMAEGRDLGQAAHVTDAVSINSWGYNQLGAASLRYRLMGSQLMLVPIADSDDSFGSQYAGYGMY